MKFKNIAAIASVLSLAAVANAQDISGQFVNLDFDSTTQSAFPGGFDIAGKDVPGWQNLTAITDSGVEGQGAWWSPYVGYSAFAKSGEGAFNLSTYAIQSGDVFDVGLMAKGWAKYANTPGAALTITLFYGSDPNQNSLGSFNTGVLTQGDTFATWTHFGSTIGATPASVGQTLGISVLSSGAAGSYGNFDSVSVAVVPEPATFSLLAFAGLGLGLMRRKNR